MIFSSASDFTCKRCKTVRSAGFFDMKGKYKCPKCGWVCGKHVSLNLFLQYKCECGKKVIAYDWNDSKKKWIQKP